MIKHIDLGQDAEERRRSMSVLIRRGEITLGGYQRGKIYCLLQCASGKKMKVENRVFFANETEAINNKYRPCGHCLPRQYKIWKASEVNSDIMNEKLKHSSLSDRTHG